MPYVPNDNLVAGPQGPHLAYLTDEGWVGITPGSTLWIVEDPSNPTKLFPLTIQKISHQKLVFAMVDSDGGVTEYHYKLASAKPKNKQALERLLKNRK